MMNYFKNWLKELRVIHFLMRVSIDIIEVRFDNMLEIVKRKGHGALEGCFDVFKAKMHFPICKSTPRTNNRRLMLILEFDLNLIIT